MIRLTYKQINLCNLKYNLEKILEYTKDYKYHIGVVKANSYNNTMSAIKVIEKYVDCLAVSSLEEALKIRKVSDIDILILEPINIKYINTAIKNNIILTVSSLDYLNKIISKKCRIHIKLNTGMNRLGINNRKEFDEVYSKINNSNLILEGIYTHLYKADDYDITKKQFEKFKYITGHIDLKSIKIIHIPNSYATINYKKYDFVNGCRLGIIMYGFNNKLELKSVFSLKTRIIEIKEMKKGETLGYDGKFKANTDVKIGVIPIGYADGLIRANTGRYVYINDRKYNIVGNICMDMAFILIDEDVSMKDDVYLIKDNKHLSYIANYLNTIPYEVMCLFKRVNIKTICHNK